MESSDHAPGELALVQRFVNTAGVEQGTDELGDTAGLTAWLAQSGLATTTDAFDAADRERVVAVREALRALLLANHGAPPDPTAIATLEQTAREAPIVVAFDASGTARLASAQTGVDGVVASLLAIVVHAQAQGTWPRLKACQNDSCRWAFYDHSRNRSRTWCSMSVCGNRAKARSYRARHR